MRPANLAPSAPGLAAVEPVLVDAIRAAELLSISERTLGDLTKRGIVPSVMLGCRRLYCLAALRQWAADGCPVAQQEGGDDAR